MADLASSLMPFKLRIIDDCLLIMGLLGDDGSSSGGSLNGELSPSIGLTGLESLKGSRCERCDVGVCGLLELRDPLRPPSIMYGGGALVAVDGRSVCVGAATPGG